MIGIIDYRMGNLRSVQKALERHGASATVIREPADAQAYPKLILPGVGAFADGMRYLRELGWVKTIQAHVAADKPLLGICLGMQLLFDSSMEDAIDDQAVSGLGIVPGRVLRFEEDQGLDQPRLKVPHMGWNTLRFNTRQDTDPNPLFHNLESGCHCYFVHGYYCVPDDPAIIAATTDYGVNFASSLRRGNLLATQFHPEKSQHVGLQMLANFAAL